MPVTGTVPAVLLLIVAASAVQRTATPPTADDLNPDRAHIEILLPDFSVLREAPHIALYPTPALNGAPAIELTGAGLCLSSSASPGCFARFVEPEFSYGDLWAQTNRPHATPEEFVDFVW